MIPRVRGSRMVGGTPSSTIACVDGLEASADDTGTFVRPYHYDAGEDAKPVTTGRESHGCYSLT